MTRQNIPFGLPSRIAMTPIRYVFLVIFILVRLSSALSPLALDPIVTPLPTDQSAFDPQLLQRILCSKDVGVQPVWR